MIRLSVFNLTHTARRAKRLQVHMGMAVHALRATRAIPHAPASPRRLPRTPADNFYANVPTCLKPRGLKCPMHRAPTAWQGTGAITVKPNSLCTPTSSGLLVTEHRSCEGVAAPGPPLAGAVQARVAPAPLPPGPVQAAATPGPAPVGAVQAMLAPAPHADPVQVAATPEPPPVGTVQAMTAPVPRPAGPVQVAYGWAPSRL